MTPGSLNNAQAGPNPCPHGAHAVRAALLGPGARQAQGSGEGELLSDRERVEEDVLLHDLGVGCVCRGHSLDARRGRKTTP